MWRLASKTPRIKLSDAGAGTLHPGPDPADATVEVRLEKAHSENVADTISGLPGCGGGSVKSTHPPSTSALFPFPTARRDVRL